MSDSNADLAAVERRDDRLVKFVLAFDKGWRDGLLNETVALTADWSEDERLEALSQLVLVDLEKEWRAGRVVLVEEYLQRWPLLETAGDGLIELLLAEWDLRQQRGEVGSAEELSKRFPERAIELARRILERESADSSLSVTATDTSRRKELLQATGSSTQATAERLEQLGRFQLEELVGEGAFGWVYRAKDSALDRVVAIKVAKSIVTDEDRQRFLREARSAAGLRHSNTCKVHDFGTLDGRDYIVMEFIDGQPLSKLLTSGTKFTELQIADTIRKAALALQEAHDKGVIHRDVKPANIMIDRFREPIVTDFGLARRDHASEALISQSGQIMGTAAYMSPEQARGDGKSVGPASDVYSLGVVLYELLCGRRPFLGTATEVLGQIQYVAVEPPSKYSPGLDPQLETICLKALSKNSAERYASMTHFAEALSDCLKVMSRSAVHHGNTAASPNASAPDTEPINSNVPELAPTTILSRQTAAQWRNISRTLWIMAGVIGVVLACGVVIIIKTSNGKFKIKWPDETVVEKKSEDDDVTKLRPAATSTSEIKPPHAGQVNSPGPIERHAGDERDDNEIGMKFCWCPPGRFLMGAQDGEEAVGATDGRVSVTLSQGFWLGKFEVTQSQYQRITGSNPSAFSRSGHQANAVDRMDTSRFPVDTVGRADALEFCRQFTASERKAGRIGDDEEFTLPTEAQWEYACRAGMTHWWVFGHAPSLQEANFGGNFDIFPDALRRTSIVGHYPANAWGLHDMPGNVTEWVRDWHRDKLTGGIDPEVARDDSDGQEVIRGGSWPDHPGALRSAGREAIKTRLAYHNTGFRVALVSSRSDANKESPKVNPPVIAPPVEPQRAQVPFEADEAKRVQQAWANSLGVPATFENSIGMTFSLVPPGEFEMGGGHVHEETLADNGNLRHRVRLTKPYYLATFETRQRDYQALMGTNPSKFHLLNNGGLDHPVEMMLVSDAEEFCRRLSGLTAEQTSQRVYRLPTEAEWEYACRAGTNTLFAFGETLTRLQANGAIEPDVPPESERQSQPVGQYAPNAWGLFDMHGNVCEWTSDFRGSFTPDAVEDPRGPPHGTFKVFRGGDFGTTNPALLSSAIRYVGGLGSRGSHMGFRVALEVPRQPAGTMKTSSPKSATAAPKVDVIDSSVKSLMESGGQWRSLVDETTALPDPAIWSFQNGVLKGGNGQKLDHYTSSEFSFPSITAKDLIVRSRVTISERVTSDVRFLLRQSDQGKYVAWNNDWFGLAKWSNGHHQQLAEIKDKYFFPREIDWAVSAIGHRLSIFVEGSRLYETTDNNHSTGSIALSVKHNGGAFREPEVMILDDLQNLTSERIHKTVNDRMREMKLNVEVRGEQKR